MAVWAEVSRLVRVIETAVRLLIDRGMTTDCAVVRGFLSQLHIAANHMLQCWEWESDVVSDDTLNVRPLRCNHVIDCSVQGATETRNLETAVLN